MTAEVVERRAHRVRERPARAVRVARTARDEVEAGEQVPEPLRVGVGRRPAAHAGRERVRLGEAAHLDRHLERVVVDAAVAVGDEREAVRGADERERPEIDAGREPPVEADLLAAQGAPALERAVVEERGTTGFLTLYARSPARKTHEQCVSTTSTASGAPGYVRGSAIAAATSARSVPARAPGRLRLAGSGEVISTERRAAPSSRHPGIPRMARARITEPVLALPCARGERCHARSLERPRRRAR